MRIKKGSSLNWPLCSSRHKGHCFDMMTRPPFTMQFHPPTMMITPYIQCPTLQPRTMMTTPLQCLVIKRWQIMPMREYFEIQQKSDKRCSKTIVWIRAFPFPTHRVPLHVRDQPLKGWFSQQCSGWLTVGKVHNENDNLEKAHKYIHIKRKCKYKYNFQELDESSSSAIISLS